MLQTLQFWLHEPSVFRSLIVVFGLGAIFLLTYLIRRVVVRRLHDNSARYQARKAANFVGYIAAMVLLLVVFSGQLGSLTVAFGVAGAGIAFALQEVIASIAGWVAVSFGNFYRVGDRVQLGGVKGDVIDIGVLRTTVMQIGEWVNGDQYNGRIVRVANSFVFKEPVFNYSGEFPFLWDEIMVPIKYGSDHRLAREIIADVAMDVVGAYASGAEEAWESMNRRYLLEKASVQPMVTLVANQNWLEFSLRYVVDYKLRRSTKDRLFTGILEQIDQTAGQVGIASTTLNIEKLAPLEVRLTRHHAPTSGTDKAG